MLDHQDGRAPALLNAIVDARELWAEAARRFPQIQAIARALFDRVTSASDSSLPETNASR